MPLQSDLLIKWISRYPLDLSRYFTYSAILYAIAMQPAKFYTKKVFAIKQRPCIYIEYGVLTHYSALLPVSRLYMIAITAITNSKCMIPPVTKPPRKEMAHIITQSTAIVHNKFAM